MMASSSLLKQLFMIVPGVLGALTVDINDVDSVKAAATLVAEDLLTFYHGDDSGGIPGVFGDLPPVGDYYWWTGSILWGTLLDLRARTGNTTYDETILQGLQWQVGPNDDYLSLNYTNDLGNDDQGFWAQAALTAKETNFIDPSSEQPQWQALAQAVFDEQSNGERRVSDSGACNGALRWQISTFNNGYNYVNTISNAGYFSIGAQLAFLTKNGTYSDEAIKTYDILVKAGLITDDFNVYDGVTVPECDAVNKIEFSYVAGVLLQGSAYLYNYTNGDAVWKTRIDGYLNHTLEIFFPDGIATEAACESSGTCTTDMNFFKGILHRSLASTLKLAPYTADKILPVLKTSAVAAVSTCTGGENGRMCGFTWSDGKFDNSTAGAQSSVLAALVSVLQNTVEVNNTGSSSDNSTSNGSNGSSGSGASNSTGSAGGSMGASVGVSFSALIGGLLVSAFMG